MITTDMIQRFFNAYGFSVLTVKENHKLILVDLDMVSIIKCPKRDVWVMQGQDKDGNAVEETHEATDSNLFDLLNSCLMIVSEK